MYLGIDTSNYTTSAATFGGELPAKNVSRLLPVKDGELGLRQSDALFHHTKQLPVIFEELFQDISKNKIKAIAASTRPRAVERSYMPCFLAGETLGRCMAKTLQVPFYAFSHQQGHIAAALYSADRLDLMEKPFLAWHLSGGTTELLLVTPEEKNVHAEIIGGTTDISAGQLIDRCGNMLNLAFPAGKSIDSLSAESDVSDCFKLKQDGLHFSLSGMQNKASEYFHKTNLQADTARYLLNSLTELILRVTKTALKEYRNLPVLFSGGVASNTLLRKKCEEISPIFARPEFSSDNAMGIAVLCSLQEK